MFVSVPRGTGRGCAQCSTWNVEVLGLVWVDLVGKKAVYDQKCCADSNSRVGDVKGWKVPSVPVNLNKIDHVAKADAIQQISDRATENKNNSEWLK